MYIKGSFQLSDAKELSKTVHKQTMNLLKQEVEVFIKNDESYWIFLGLLESHIDLILNDNILNAIGDSENYINLIDEKENNNYINYLLITKTILTATYCYSITKLPNDFRDEVDLDTIINMTNVIFPYIENFKNSLKVNFKNYDENHEENDFTNKIIAIFSEADESDRHDAQLAILRRKSIEKIFKDIGLTHQTTRTILITSDIIIDNWYKHAVKLMEG